jgi:hypothetical protein
VAYCSGGQLNNEYLLALSQQRFLSRAGSAPNLRACKGIA